MLLSLWSFLCLTTVTTLEALEITYQALDNPKEKICGDYGSCDPEVSRFNENLLNRNCMCDENCVKYGDCCIDSKYYNLAEELRAISEYECEPFEQLKYVYMKTSCPPSWPEADTRRKCEMATNRSVEDPLRITPVTNLETNITYGNVYCAECNDDATLHELDFWKLSLECKPVDSGEPLPSNYDRDYFENNLRYNAVGGAWEIVERNSTYTCDLGRSIGDKAASRIRHCVPTVNTCPATWGKENIRERCESHTLIMYARSSGEKSYRNIHCAMCNFVPIQSLHCNSSRVTELRTRIFVPTRSFSLLFDFKGGESAGREKPCRDGQIRDIFYKTCRDIAVDASPSSVGSANDVNHTTFVSRLSNCTKILLDQAEFENIKDQVKLDEYFYYNSSYVEICASQPMPKFKPYFGIITHVGIGISVACLVAHLIVFALLEELRNLSGKNLASMCFALTIAYCSFIAGDWLQGKACFVDGVVTYYFFLATFTWMLIMSFDVWRTLKIATKELRVNSGTQWRKFLIYSFCSWALPAKIVLVAVLIELCPMKLLDDKLKPNFEPSCWFGQASSMLIFFGVPVFLILVCNLVFFVSSTYMIYSSQSMTRYSASSHTKRDFRLYARLALIMGLTWIIGLVAGFVDNDVVWLLFVLCNTLLGLFVFVAFTWRTKVLRSLKTFGRDKGLHLPAFSWAVASDDDKSSSMPEKQTSNTYY